MNSIAVIIPVGPGHERLADRAVRSVLAQSWYATPLIVNDTGRADQCSAAAGVMQVDTGVPGGGVGSARQLGTEHAAELGYSAVVYLDADDMLLPRAIEAMVGTYNALNPAYVYGDGYNVLDTASRKVHYYRAAEYDRRLYAYQNIHNVTALLPVGTALAVRWTDQHWEDYIYYSSLALAGLCGARTPYPVIAYDLSAGARRNAAHAYGADYARSLLTDYRRKFGLVKDKNMCCGNAPTGMTASGEQMLSAAPNVVQPAGTVALGYTGNNAGGVEYRVNGRSYTGEAGGVVYAKPADVAALIGFGKFYELPAPPEIDAVIGAMITEAAALIEPTTEQLAAMSELGMQGAAAGAKLAETLDQDERQSYIASALGVPAEILEAGIIGSYAQNVAALDEINAREAETLDQAAAPKPRQRRTRKPKS